MENLSKYIQESIDKLKKQFELLIENKENLKINISKVFTQIRSSLNEREDELLTEVDKQFDELFIKEEKMKEWEKLPDKVKISLELGKTLSEQWNNNKKLSYLIDNCLNIENNINVINVIDENIKKLESKNIDLLFKPEEKEKNKFLDKIKNFGKISFVKKNYFFQFSECPTNLKDEQKYKVSGEKKNIVTKIGDGWVCIICQNELNTTKEEFIWKIKIKKSYNYCQTVGVSRKYTGINIEIVNSIRNNKGWFYNGYTGTLYSGPPHNYCDKNINLGTLSKEKNEIIVIMNMKKKTLKFII